VDLVQLGGLSPKARLDVDARHLTGAADCDDFCDLGEGEAKPPRDRDELEHRQHLVSVHPISSFGPGRRCENPDVLVQPDRLPGKAATCRNLADQEPVTSHGPEDRPSPQGQGQGGSFRNLSSKPRNRDIPGDAARLVELHGDVARIAANAGGHGGTAQESGAWLGQRTYHQALI